MVVKVDHLWVVNVALLLILVVKFLLRNICGSRLDNPTACTLITTLTFFQFYASPGIVVLLGYWVGKICLVLMLLILVGLLHKVGRSLPSSLIVCLYQFLVLTCWSFVHRLLALLGPIFVNSSRLLISGRLHSNDLFSHLIIRGSFIEQQISCSRVVATKRLISGRKHLTLYRRMTLRRETILMGQIG